MASKQKPLPKVERVNDKDERKKALETALKAIEKACGKGAVMRMADDAAEKDIETVSTGSLSLDLALGVGGLPRGRIIEVYGPESSGKTTLALHVVSEMQKTGGTCAYVDAEHALDPLYAAKLGVKMPELLLSQPNSGEEALEITDALVRSGAVDLVVVDSVAALVPRSEIEGEMGDALPGLQARLMSQALRKITSSVQKTKSLVIFINQIRYKIGGYGNPETTAGGNALKFYATVRLDIRRKLPIKKNDEILGNETVVKVVKNKVAPPFKLAHFDIMYGEGISHYGELIDMAEENGIFEKSGSWYAYQGKKLGQGKEKVRDKLKAEPELAAEVENKIRTMKGIRIASCKTADEEYAEEQALIAAAQRRPPQPAQPRSPEVRPEGEPPSIDWHDIPVTDDAMSKEEVEEALGY